LQSSDAVERYSEHLRRGRAVEISAGLEGFDQPPVAREIREDPHLDLREVGNDQLSSGGSAKTGAIFNRVRHLLKTRR